MATQLHAFQGIDAEPELSRLAAASLEDAMAARSAAAGRNPGLSWPKKRPAKTACLKRFAARRPVCFTGRVSHGPERGGNGSVRARQDFCGMRATMRIEVVSSSICSHGRR